MENSAKEYEPVTRPWGSYQTLNISPQFHIKHIIVKPNQKLSLQSHNQRAEHWMIIKGTATVINGDKTFDLQKDQSTFIPKQTKHRLINNTNEDIHLVEVQVGEYFGEDDIIRYEDIYDRT